MEVPDGRVVREHVVDRAHSGDAARRVQRLRHIPLRVVATLILKWPQSQLADKLLFGQSHSTPPHNATLRSQSVRSCRTPGPKRNRWNPYIAASGARPVMSSGTILSMCSNPG